MVLAADTGVVDDDSGSLKREQAGQEPTEPGRDTARRLAVVAVVVAAAPILVAGLRAAVRGWTPTGDDAYSAIRAWDVFSTNPPLLGTWSSAALYTDHQINHPGALHFDLLAVPVRLLGHGPGTAIGLALINAAAVALIGWLVARRLGSAAATVAMALSALLAWSMGSEILYSPWSQHAPLLPFALFLVAVWCAAAGDVVALPIMVVAGNYALQTHLSYALLVPGLLLFALGAVAWRVVRQRRADPDGWPELRRRSLLWAAITAATQLVVGIQPLVEQLFGSGQGNVTGLLHSASADAPTPGLGATIRAFGSTVALPPAWLPPSFGSPAFDLNGDGPSTVLAAGSLLALATAIGVLGWRARQRGSTAVAAGSATALVALVLALVTIPRAPIRWGLVPTYLRWMWPLGMVLWLVLAAGVLDELRARARARAQADAGDANDDADDADADAAEARKEPSGSPWREGVGWVVPGLAVAVVAAIAALPTVDNGSASPPWVVEAVQEVDDDVVDAADDAGSVLVRFSPHFYTGAFGPPLLAALQDAGVPFYVDEATLVRQLGNGRRFEPGDATVQLRVIADRVSDPDPDQQLVAEWSELTADDRAELDRLDEQVEDLVAEHGLPLGDGVEDYLERARDREMQEQIAELEDDPAEAVSSGLVRELWSGEHATFLDGPLLDTDVFPQRLLDRWADLRLRAEERVLQVYVGPIES